MSDRALAIGLGVSIASFVAAVFAMGYLAGMASLRRKILESARGRLIHGDATPEVWAQSTESCRRGWDATRTRRGA